MKKNKTKFVIKNLIGKGAFSKVYKGLYFEEKEKEPTEVAIKIMNKKSLELPRDEVEIIKNIEHPNVIKFIDDIYKNNTRWVISELCEWGNLSKYLDTNYNNIQFQENDIKSIFIQIANGLDFLHSKNIVHRDLKLENLFINKDFIIKIGDFGFARTINNDNQLLKSVLGTPLYMAPEMILKKKKNKINYDSKCDIWALGVILVQLIYGKSIVNDIKSQNELFDVLSKLKESNNKFKLKKNISNECKNLIKQLLEIDFNKRLNIKEILIHPWLNQMKKPEFNILESINLGNKKYLEINKNKEFIFTLSIELIYKLIIEFNKIYENIISIVEKIENIITYLKLNEKNNEEDFIFLLYLKMADLIYKITLNNGLDSNLSEDINILIFSILKIKTEYDIQIDIFKNKLSQIYTYIKSKNKNKINLNCYKKNIIYKYLKFLEKTILSEVELINNEKNKNYIWNNYKICKDLKDIINYDLNILKIDIKFRKIFDKIDKEKLFEYIKLNQDIIKSEFENLDNQKFDDDNISIICTYNNYFFNRDEVKNIFNPIENSLNIRINKINTKFN